MSADLSDGTVWIDLASPDVDETARLEELLGFAIPTLDEMREIEVSSRLFMASEAAFMTAIVPARGTDDRLELGPVTFILHGSTLITIRYHGPHAFQTIHKRIGRLGLSCDSGAALMVALLEAIVDNLADMLEETGGQIEALSRTVFDEKMPGRSHGGLGGVLRGIGKSDDAVSRIGDALATMTRLASFLTQFLIASTRPNPFSPRMKALTRDLRSLTDHAGFLAGKIAVLLDATLGMINIEQNNIIKIFSVISMVFLPPTLIASIYGMNFTHLPELSWPFGYPLALLVMLASAILPYLYFRYRGWLRM